MNPTEELRRTSDRERPLVLIVEDQQELRELYAQQLAMSGFDVIEAGNGADAIDHTSARLPDVVLMDLSLPVLTGWEAAQQLKQSGETRAIPIIALSAHALEGERDKALAAGCDDFESKPVDLARLLGKLAALIPVGSG